MQNLSTYQQPNHTITMKASVAIEWTNHAVQYRKPHGTIAVGIFFEYGREEKGDYFVADKIEGYHVCGVWKNLSFEDAKTVFDAIEFADAEFEAVYESRAAIKKIVRSKKTQIEKFWAIVCLF